MCSDIDETIDFYTRWFAAEVVNDVAFAGARNVFLRIGDGRIHLYDQPPRSKERSAVHHLGIQTDDFEGLVARMKAGGFEFRKPITDDPLGRYVMVEAPDRVLLELFEPNRERTPARIRPFFFDD